MCEGQAMRVALYVKEGQAMRVGLCVKVRR